MRKHSLLSPIQEVGSGSEFVYVYYFPSDKADTRWPCKIGRSKRFYLKRILTQQASMKETPIIGLLIHTHSCIETESRIHTLLKPNQLKTFGREWFLTSPNEVAELYNNNKIQFEIGAQIRIMRTQKQLTQTQLGKEAGVRQETISLVENDFHNVQLSTVTKIAKALQLRLLLVPI